MARAGLVETLKEFLSIGNSALSGVRKLLFKNSDGILSLESTPTGNCTVTIPSTVSSTLIARTSDGFINYGHLYGIANASFYAGNRSMSIIPSTGSNNFQWEIRNGDGGIIYLDWTGDSTRDFDARFSLNAGGTAFTFDSGANLVNGYIFTPTVTFNSSTIFNGTINSTAPLCFTNNTALNTTGTARFFSNNLIRWDIGKSGSTETGNNAGAEFYIAGYNDAGSSPGVHLSISRATGITSLTGLNTANANLTGGNIGNAVTFSNVNLDTLADSSFTPSNFGLEVISQTWSGAVRGKIEAQKDKLDIWSFSTNYELSTADNNMVINMTNENTTLSIPNASTVDIPVGYDIIINAPNGGVTLAIAAGVTINNGTLSNGMKIGPLAGTGGAFRLVKTATNTWIALPSPQKITLVFAAAGTTEFYATPGASSITVDLVGGGGGGGSGRSRDTGTQGGGGAGGRGGNRTQVTLPLEPIRNVLGSGRMRVTVGAGGNGGTTPPANTNGITSTAGGATTLEYYNGTSWVVLLTASGGANATGGGATAGGTSQAPGVYGFQSTAAGSGGASGAGSNATASFSPAPGGGGGGAGINTGNTATAGGAGHFCYVSYPQAGGTGGAAGGAGQQGTAQPLSTLPQPGPGGGGGGSTAGAAGGAGAAGRTGAGGGGGGAGTPGGAGGAGGTGYAIVSFS